MFSCPLHSWFSYESCCPACQKEIMLTNITINSDGTSSESTPSNVEGKGDVKCNPHWWRGNKEFGKRICARCGQYEGEPQTSLPEGVSAEGMSDDLLVQVREHIRKDNLFDWHEALSENEMTYLENLLLTYAPQFPVGSIGYNEQRKALTKQEETIRGKDKELEELRETWKDGLSQSATLLGKKNNEIEQLQSLIKEKEGQLQKSLNQNIKDYIESTDTITTLQSQLDKANEEIGELRKIITAEVEITKKYKALAEAAGKVLSYVPLSDRGYYLAVFSEALTNYQTLKQQL